MLTLRFSNPADPRWVESERSPAFLLDVASIATHPQGSRVALYSGGQWWIASRGFLEVSCAGPVACSAAVEPARRFGAFSAVRLVDGVLLGDERPLARVQPARGWTAVAGNEAWRSILVEST